MSITFRCMITRKTPPPFGILRNPSRVQKSKMAKHLSQCSLPQSPTICLDTRCFQVCPQLSTGLWRLHRLLGHIVLSGAFRNLPRKRLGDGIPNRYTSCATSVPCEKAAGQKWPKAETKRWGGKTFSLKPIKNLIL